MKYYVYYLLAGLFMLHPHLWQKLSMLWNYLTIPGYRFWSTFSALDVFDLFLHAGIPFALIMIGIKKQRALR
jgi:hypothetical protein